MRVQITLSEMEADFLKMYARTSHLQYSVTQIVRLIVEEKIMKIMEAKYLAPPPDPKKDPLLEELG